MSVITILGAGGFGTALAVMCQNKGIQQQNGTRRGEDALAPFELVKHREQMPQNDEQTADIATETK